MRLCTYTYIRNDVRRMSTRRDRYMTCESLSQKGFLSMTLGSYVIPCVMNEKQTLIKR